MTDKPMDDELDEILSRMESELTDLGTRYFKREIPDIMTLTDMRKLVTDEAKRRLQALLVRERYDEQMHTSMSSLGSMVVYELPDKVITQNERLEQLKGGE